MTEQTTSQLALLEYKQWHENLPEPPVAFESAPEGLLEYKQWPENLPWAGTSRR